MTLAWSSIAALFARAPRENREHREPLVRPGASILILGLL